MIVLDKPLKLDVVTCDVMVRYFEKLRAIAQGLEELEKAAASAQVRCVQAAVRLSGFQDDTNIGNLGVYPGVDGFYLFDMNHHKVENGQLVPVAGVEPGL